MTREVRVLVDVDGVLANFIEGFRKEARLVTGRPCDQLIDQVSCSAALGLSSEEEGAAFARVRRPGWAYNLKPYQQGVEAIHKIASFADVYFVTAPLPKSETWTYDRTRWLHDHFPKLSHKIVHTENKHLVSGDEMIEDTWAQAGPWLAQNPNGVCHMPAMGYNAHVADGPKVNRFLDWEFVVNLIRMSHNKNNEE